MIDLFVFRGAGDKDGGEIFNPLLSDVSAALQRGKFEIDFNTPTIQNSLEVVYSPGLRLGQQVSVSDSRTGMVIYGVVKSFSHVINGVTLFSKIDIEVPQ